MSDIGQAFQDSLAGLSSAFSGGGGSGVAPTGTDLGTALSQAFSAAGGTAGATPSTTIDPTGSIGAQLAITPPGTSDPTGSIGGTQSDGAPQSTSSSSAGQGGGQNQQDQQKPQTSNDTLRRILQALTGQAVNPYQLGAGGQPTTPMTYPRWPGDPAYRPPSAATPGGSNEGASVQPEYGPGRPYEGPPGPGSREGESVQPEYGPGKPAGLPATTPDVPAAPGGAGPPAGGGAAPPAGGIEGLPPPGDPRSLMPPGGLPGLPGIVPPGAGTSGLAALLYSLLYPSSTQATEPGVTPSEAGLAPPGTGQGSYPPSTSYAPGGLPQGVQKPPADPTKPPDPTKPTTKTADQPPTKKDQPPTKPLTKKDQPPPTRQAPPPGFPPGGPPPMPPPMGAGLGAILGPLMQSGLPQLALMALASGLGGRRRHHGGHWRGGRPNMGHFYPHFHRHDRDGGGFAFNPALMGMMGGPQGPQGGPGQGGPAPTMQRYQPRPGQTTADQTPTSGQIPGVSAQDVDKYVRDQALQMGIDPDVASRLVGGESSFGQNWANPRDTNGYPSYGPFQLNMAPGAMGDQFYRDTGLNPADPKNWQAEVRYALKKAREGGWSPWQTTAGNLGYDRWQGINRNWQPIPQDASAGALG